jgi:dUTP pyrophosphatase
MTEDDDATPVILPVDVGDGGTLPEYASAGAAGADLRASAAVEIPPGGRAAVPTDLRLQIPRGHVGLVWPRSGLAVRHGIDTLAGVVDSDYRGEVRVERPGFVAAPRVDETERGEGGFGSTGR